MASRTRRAATTAALLTLALGAAACGDDDDEGGGGTAKQLTLTMTEKGGHVAYDLPPSIESGLYEITVSNAGRKRHSAAIIGVDGDHDAADALKVINQDQGVIPGWLHGLGGAAEVAPGASTKIVQKLEPGRHLLQDDTAEPSEPEDTQAFTVTGGAAEGELPTTTASVVMDEYSFVTKGLRAGRNTVLVRNAGTELHHTLAFPMRKGATLADVRAFAASEGEGGGRPPVDFEGGTGTAVFDGGFSQVVDLDLEAGRYALICFLPDRAGGPPHAAKGMIGELEVE